MTIRQLACLTSAVAMLAGLTACSDAPSAPAANVTVAAAAASFDALADDAALGGALTAADDWHLVAAALRAGLTPSRIEIMTFGKMEEYNAFVRADDAVMVETAPRKNAGHMMLAWQWKNREVINHALRLWAPGDSGRIVNHAGIHDVGMPIGAHLDYAERGWGLGPISGENGVAFLKERWAEGRCAFDAPALNAWRPPEGMICQKALFNVRFEATFKPIENGDPIIDMMKVMWMKEQPVRGVKFVPNN